MKPHPRIRKTVKWGGAAVMVLLAVVWIGSGWWWVNWTKRGRSFTVSAGIVDYADYFPQGPFSGWYCGRHHAGLYWVPPPWPPGAAPPNSQARVPLWAPFLLAIGVTFLGWRLDALARRRADRTHCPKCGYDRTGLALDAKCPECGTLRT